MAETARRQPAGKTPDKSDAFDRLAVADRGGAARLTVHVRPRSGKNAVVGVREGALDVALTAPPIDGAANDELVRLLAKLFGVRRADVVIVTGASGRTKLVDVTGVDAASIRARLGGATR